MSGVRSRRAPSRRSADPNAMDELIVVTLLVASAGGDLGLPKQVSSLQDLQETLRKLGGLGREQVVGVEVRMEGGARAHAWGQVMRGPRLQPGASVMRSDADAVSLPVAPAMQVMWTPQAEGDVFTREEIASDFPDLVPL